MSRLIDADKLIELIDDDIASLDFMNMAMSREGYDVCLCTLRMVKQYIKALPTVEPEKHGRWIVCDDLYKTIDGRVFDGYRECSVCGEMYPYFPEHNYCPNCGADMREVSE